MDVRPSDQSRMPFTIAIGNEVHGPDGKLGEVDRVIVDADSDRISEIVVKHGLPLLGKERLIPLSHVQRADGSTLYVDVDQEQFSELAGFDADQYRTPDPDYAGPPGYDGRSGQNVPYGVGYAAGPLLFYRPGRAAFGDIGGDQPGNSAEYVRSRPSVSAGDAILSSDYEKVGEVGAFEVDERGFPTRITVRTGFLFKHESDLPAEWIANLTEDGVVLNVDAATIEGTTG